ncbi:MFS transporter [Halieaceae bacterium IMCC8485]|jgi:predicted MFS family arabinose efflux permease|uniref:MFS transporter n=2 Tax=Candidatus Seongchinamella marina TaxID=2518990 RepID=A0ABT3STT3_9GAMM|nr:MFS transporter [Candidatus Seongchinamella marina]MBT5007033.1 MFS transporter [Halieaceae bacterium]MCX2973391.1 MFS transporter [Candidatus Seongchinamella marina]
MLTLVYAFNFIDRQLLAILQESIKADLSLSDSQLGLLTGFAFAIFYVTAGIPIARWADHANRRNIVAGSLFIWSFMTALSGMVQNYTQLVLARIGVGIGEAGGSPPSHSMISDIFPPNRRATALGFYSTGVSFGILFGFLFGGWLNEYFGWRTAFLVVGIPGVFLSGLIMLTLREPTRGLIEQKTVTAESVPLKKVIQTLWESRTFRHLSLAASLNAFSGYSTASWTASFMIRSHEMSTGELGTWLAIIIGLCGAIGVFFGGMAADWLSPRDKRWYMWLPAISGFIAVPFMVAVYLADTPYVALSMMLIPGLLHQVYLGNTLATTHNLVGLKMRATSSAILFFILNIIGLGCGPFLVGVLSDQLSASHGADSLRLAMLYLLPAVMFWSACHFYFASKHLRKDLEAAPA